MSDETETAEAQDGTTTIPFLEGCIRDDLAKRMLINADFLWTGKPAEVGQYAEIAVKTNHHPFYGHCHVRGLVTSVGPLPTFEEWIMSKSAYAPPPEALLCEHNIDPYHNIRPDTEIPYGCNCDDPNCTTAKIAGGTPGFHPIALGTLRERVQDLYGTLHGQQVTGFAFLDADFFHVQEHMPIKSGRIYRLVLEANDSMKYAWTVHSIEDASGWPAERMPKIFREWEGLSGGIVAPFDLTDAERKEWLVQHEADIAKAREEEEAERKAKSMAIKARRQAEQDRQIWGIVDSDAESDEKEGGKSKEPGA